MVTFCAGWRRKVQFSKWLKKKSVTVQISSAQPRTNTKAEWMISKEENHSLTPKITAKMRENPEEYTQSYIQWSTQSHIQCVSGSVWKVAAPSSQGAQEARDNTEASCRVQLQTVQPVSEQAQHSIRLTTYPLGTIFLTQGSCSSTTHTLQFPQEVCSLTRTSDSTFHKQVGWHSPSYRTHKKE